jgi:hypothetical protein
MDKVSNIFCSWLYSQDLGTQFAVMSILLAGAYYTLVTGMDHVLNWIAGE